MKPGVYTLTYVYTDPYDENMHDIHALGFKRTVIVLPLPGDVDMDGDVTVADGALLQRLLKEGFFTDSETFPCLMPVQDEFGLYSILLCPYNISLAVVASV